MSNASGGENEDVNSRSSGEIDISERISKKGNFMKNAPNESNE